MFRSTRSTRSLRSLSGSAVLPLATLALLGLAACSSSSSADGASSGAAGSGTAGSGSGAATGGTSAAAGSTTATGGTASSTGGASSSAGGTSSAGAGGAPATGGTGGTGTAGSSDAGAGGGTAEDKTYTFTMDTFTVDAGTEVYRCQNFANPFGADVEVSKFESHMAAGSHHLLMFYQPVTDGALETCSGLEFHASPYGTQLPDDEVVYPDGIAALVKQTDGFRFQSHYLNTTGAPITAKVEVTFHIAAPGTIQQHAGVLFVIQPQFAIKPHTTQVVTKSCKMPLDMNLLLGSSHMHQHGTHFEASVAGNSVYTTNTWDNPKPKVFAPPIPSMKGDALNFACTFQNDSDATLTFGESALTNEMCIFSAQYYPLPDGTPATIDCN